MTDNLSKQLCELCEFPEITQAGIALEKYKEAVRKEQKRLKG